MRQVGGFGIAADGSAYDARSDEARRRGRAGRVGDRVVGQLTPEAPARTSPRNLGLPGADRSGFSGIVRVRAAGDPDRSRCSASSTTAGPIPISPPRRLRGAPATGRRRRVDPGGHRSALAGWADGLWTGGPPGPGRGGRARRTSTSATTSSPPSRPTARSATRRSRWSTSSVVTGRLRRQPPHPRCSVLAEAGDDIAVRVGSCLQWHGFSGSQLVIDPGGRRADQAGRALRRRRVTGGLSRR